MSVSGTSSESLRGWLVAAIFLILFATAWVADDAYISFRTVQNLVGGDGLTWNPGERVQVFTHPLWFFVHAAAAWFTGEIFYTTLLICAACSLVAIYLLVFRLARSAVVGLWVAAALVASRGFIDYSSSGLENPLTHLLVVLFVGWGWYRDSAKSPPHLILMAALVALLGLNRIDLLGLVLPAFGVAWWRADRADKVRSGLLLALPLLAWEIFSVIYFGAPVPNTAPAKLGTGVGLPGRIVQGLYYYASCGLQDGLTLAILTWILISMWRQVEARPLAVGVFCYLLYVVSIGGDSMLGRFLTPPFVLVIAWAACCPDLVIRPSRRPAAILAATLLTLRVCTTFFGSVIDPVGIGDERRAWYPQTGLVLSLFSEPWPELTWYTRIGIECPTTPCLSEYETVGLFGYFADPGVVILDTFALTDPFRSRLPGLIGHQFNLPGRLAWRPSHVARPIPAGLIESIQSGTNQIVDPDLAELYRAVQLVTRGPLWAEARWEEIWKLNTGAYDDHVERWKRRHPEWYEPSS